ncbi:TPA: hypothetical protein LU100_004472 [Enterobacter cloacae]|nr:hypothetical protein [Enterobacter cloacae]
MAKNEFKPFSIAGGANVISQADYEVLAALSTGFTAGVAKASEINKVLRQASFVAAALAQFISDKTNSDVLDDGSLSGFETKLIAALNALSQPLDATLTALAGLQTSPNKVPYFTDADIAALTDLTLVGRNIIGKGSVSEVVQYLGLQNALVKGSYGLGSRDSQSAASKEHVGSFFYEPFQPGTLYPDSVVAIESAGPTSQEWGQFAVSYGAAIRVFAAHKSYSGQPETTELYHDKRKPTSSDVGAYPLTGGILNGNLSATGSVTSGAGKDISSAQDLWAGRDIYAQRNLSVTSIASVGSDLTVGGSVGVTGNVDAGGFVRSGAGKDVVSQNDIWASRYIYENGQRLYGPNNPPPNKFSKSLNTISWEKNLETGVIRQWGFVDVGDNAYVTVNLPIAFPSSFLSLTVTPRVPGAVSGTDVVSAFGQIQTNSTFGAGVSANFPPGWSGVYFEAIGV